MKKAIVCYSQTEFTEKYANRLAKDFEHKALPYSAHNDIDLGSLNVLVFYSWFHAAFVKSTGRVKRTMAQHPGLHVFVLITGTASIANAFDRFGMHK